MSAPQIVVVAGPTAAGKTRLGILLPGFLFGHILKHIQLSV